MRPCIHPSQVVSVDCNPAQSALLELKAVAIQQLEYEDVWQLFGEGVHPRIDEVRACACVGCGHGSVGSRNDLTQHGPVERMAACPCRMCSDSCLGFTSDRTRAPSQVYETHLAPFLSQTSNSFWSSRLWYFKQGLYFQGGMVRSCVLRVCLVRVGCVSDRDFKRFTPDAAQVLSVTTQVNTNVCACGRRASCAGCCSACWRSSALAALFAAWTACSSALSSTGRARLCGCSASWCRCCSSTVWCCGARRVPVFVG